MSMRVVCPEGHLVQVAESNLGGRAFCPCCRCAFHVELSDTSVRRARNDEKGRKSRDDDGDDEIEFLDDDAPQAKKPAKKKDDAHDEVEFLDDEPPVVKKAPVKKADDDVVEFLDEDEPAAKKSSAKPAKKDADKEAIAEGEAPAKKSAKPAKKDADDGAIAEGDAPVKKKPAKKSTDDDEVDAPRVKKAPRDEDEDDEDDDDEDDEDDEDEDDDEDRPRKRKSRRDQDDDDDDDDPDRVETKAEKDARELQEDIESIVWNPRKRMLRMVRIALICYQVSAISMFVMFLADVLGGLVCFVMLFIALFTGDPAIFLVTQGIFLMIIGVGAIVVVGSNVVAWVIGAIFSPDKSGGKAMSITAIGLFCLPGFFFLAYLVFSYTVITRDQVAANLMRMTIGFSALAWLLAIYYGLLYIGRMCAFMGRSIDSRKPAALGWFIIGGYLARIIGTIAILLILVVFAIIGLIPLIIVMGLIAFNWWVCYFVVTSLFELIEVIVNLRKEIDKYILYG